LHILLKNLFRLSAAKCAHILPGFSYEKHAPVRVLTKPRPAGSERFRTGWSRNAYPARRGFESTILAESIKTL